jgi:diguanylate cyclase (GGDEF)-like protein
VLQDVRDLLPCALVELDVDGVVLDSNARFLQWAGLDTTEVVGLHLAEILVGPAEADGTRTENLPALAELRRRDGSRHPVLVADGVVDADGRRVLALFDAVQQRVFETHLLARHAMAQRTQSRLELVIAASIAFTDAGNEQELAAILADTTAKAYAAEQSVVFLLDEHGVFRHAAGTNPFDEFPDAKALEQQGAMLATVLKVSGIEAARAISPSVGAAFESTGVQAMIIAPIRQRNQPLGILAAFFHHPRQFDEQASPLADALAGQAARAIVGLRLQQRLEHAAMHDDTTGLPNRRLLEETVETALVARHTDLAVLFVDLDGFKEVNDQLGHQVGDEILREVATRLQSTVRVNDIVSRYGGDEFVILCEVAGEDAALEMAERVRVSISRPYGILPAGLAVGASVGVAVASTVTGRGGVDRLVRMADQAMYRAKNAGGNRVAL